MEASEAATTSFINSIFDRSHANPKNFHPINSNNIALIVPSECKCPGEDQNIDLPAIMESLIAAIIYAIAGFLISRMWYMLEPKANQLFEIILFRSYLRLRTVSQLSTFSDTVEEVVEPQNRRQTISKSVFIDFSHLARAN